MKKPALLLCLAAAPLLAALEPVHPVGGETVPLLPDVQKKVLEIPSLAGRIAYFDGHKGDKTVHCGTLYRTSRPLVFRFRDSGNPDGPSWNGPWKVFIGKQPDRGISDYIRWSCWCMDIFR